MLDFFRRLRDDGRLVFLCVHPNERLHLEILQEACDHFIFVQQGSVTPLPGYQELLNHAPVRSYLGALLGGRAA